MENLQFDIDEDQFECVQCNEIVHIGKACKKQLDDDSEAFCEIACKCGTIFIVGKNPNNSGYIVTEKTGSASEAEEITEKELEDE